ncbi:MAG TPA: hypothetical protein VGQ83_43100 [Polyangia bacterium]|jgi:hypothetical protein
MPTGVLLFDLDADPAEARDRAADLPIARRLCEVHLGEGLGVPQKSRRADAMALPYRVETSRGRLDPQLKRQLEALGYLSD